jgi:hypothetical protein
MCDFLIFCEDPRKKRIVDKAVVAAFSRIGGSDTSPERYSSFGTSCENLSEADKTVARLRSIDGVSSVKVRVMKELIVVQDWLKGELDKRVSA